MLDSLFIAGTDTDVGKTYVTAGLAASARMLGIDVGVMKPFAAGVAQKTGFKSHDAEFIARAAGSDDEEDLVNPQFFPIPASPYTAWKELGLRPRVKTVLSRFKTLQKSHQAILVEGMGGLMTPILDDYFVADLAAEMGLPALIVTGSQIGTINHTIMTARMCSEYGIPIRGIVINRFRGGYPKAQLARDLQALTGVRVWGSIPSIADTGARALCRMFAKCIDVEGLLGLRPRESEGRRLPAG